MKTLKAIIQLTRPANVITSVADIWGGAAIAYGLASIGDNSSFFTLDLLFLSVASACLYAGGITLNDYFDAELDAVERPERAIPRGDISRSSAGLLGAGLLLAGLIVSFFVGWLSALIAFILAGLIIAYNAKFKPYDWLGPINMGLCRGANLLLGISIFPILFPEIVWMGILPLIFIAAITVISKGEVLGGNKKAMQTALCLYLIIIAGLIALFFAYDSTLFALIFIVLWTVMVIRPLVRAITSLSPKDVKKAVKMGVLSLILLDASYAAVFYEWQSALYILFLLPISVGLSKWASVT